MYVEGDRQMLNRDYFENKCINRTYLGTCMATASITACPVMLYCNTQGENDCPCDFAGYRTEERAEERAEEKTERCE